MYRTRTAFMAALLSLLLPAFAHAQAAPDPRVQITPAQAATFFSAFTALAKQAHVALVAEDQPLHMTLTPQAAAGLKLTPDGEPLSTLLPRLAAAYDYDVQPSGAVFLLRKRYTAAADLPSVTAKECALGLAELDGYAENFNPHLPLSPRQQEAGVPQAEGQFASGDVTDPLPAPANAPRLPRPSAPPWATSSPG